MRKTSRGGWAWVIVAALCVLCAAGSAEDARARRFRAADKNGDGQLTPVEVPNARLFKTLDKNGDGVVTAEEAGVRTDAPKAGASTEAGAKAPAAPARTQAGPGRSVYHIGHSLVAPVIGPLALIARAAGYTGHAHGEQIYGGTSARRHWEKTGAKQKAKPALETGRYDVLTIGAYYHDKPEHFEQWIALARKANPKIGIYIQDAWPRAEGGHVAPMEEYAKQQAALNAQVAACVDALNRKFDGAVHVIPVGDAMVELRRRMEAGKAPGLAKVYGDLYKDPIHPTPTVAVLEGYVYFACLYGKSPVGLPNLFEDYQTVRGRARLSDELNRVLQEVAWQVVTAHPLTGVKAEEK